MMFGSLVMRQKLMPMPISLAPTSKKAAEVRKDGISKLLKT